MPGLKIEVDPGGYGKLPVVKSKGVADMDGVDERSRGFLSARCKKNRFHIATAFKDLPGAARDSLNLVVWFENPFSEP